MLSIIDLQGSWSLQLDADKRGLVRPLQDTITLPNTTSHARKGPRRSEAHAGHLTDEYAFEGYAWFEREVDIPESWAGKTVFLYLERTRVTTVWIDGEEVGTQNSLNAPHLYELTGLLGTGKHTLTIRVDNTSYPTKGGHMTSPDTQTNWNGITGRIELQLYGEAYLKDVQVYPNANGRFVQVKALMVGDVAGKQLAVSAVSLNGESEHEVAEQRYPVDGANLSIKYELGADARLWSDQQPNLYQLRLQVLDAAGEVFDRQEVITGLRDFQAAGDSFTINGNKTFLRGKHDGLIFPLTGYAPTDVEEWLRILGIAKSYGINHYRFHTCCPPEAAFIAADMLGIYMQPELPFWGTITDEEDEQHNQAEQDYLISEGYAILNAFGNHPSFVMMSLGNELWGSKERLNAILKAYKAHDQRHLYTQGSNNFQFVPVILEEDDFFSGVRFSRDRLFRGSYAMCDAPLGHVQTDYPSTMKDYDAHIIPGSTGLDGKEEARGGTIQIQYGTEAKTVKADAAEALVPAIPVVSHEIGQYAMYPNYDEIAKYTGPLKAKNLEIFRERLERKGLGHLWRPFFECSGKLAVDCYKEELEAAFRSRHLAGFQILDLQDFSGQGTALVGILDAFMDTKGLVTPEEWRSFCSDAVLLARFASYHHEAGDRFRADVELRYYREEPLTGRMVKWELRSGKDCWASGELRIGEYPEEETLLSIGELVCTLPAVSGMTKIVLSLAVEGTDIWKTYDLWVYPKAVQLDWSGVRLFQEWHEEAAAVLEQGGNLLLLLKPERVTHAVKGLYSTDFWCYPMFRSISESMQKPVPVGTLGLLIDNEHPALAQFPSEKHSTYPWWSVVMHSRSLILDDLPNSLQPIVQTIDNFERNHKLGLLFECEAANGRVLVGALDTDRIVETVEGRQFIASLLDYVKSERFRPQTELTLEQLRKVVQ